MGLFMTAWVYLLSKLLLKGPLAYSGNMTLKPSNKALGLYTSSSDNLHYSEPVWPSGNVLGW